jgi:hypothetical protein
VTTVARDAEVEVEVEARRRQAEEDDAEVEGELGVEGGLLDLVEREARRMPGAHGDVPGLVVAYPRNQPAICSTELTMAGAAASPAVTIGARVSSDPVAPET